MMHLLFRVLPDACLLPPDECSGGWPSRTAVERQVRARELHCAMGAVTWAFSAVFVKARTGKLVALDDTFDAPPLFALGPSVRCLLALPCVSCCCEASLPGTALRLSGGLRESLDLSKVLKLAAVVGRIERASVFSGERALWLAASEQRIVHHLLRCFLSVRAEFSEGRTSCSRHPSIFHGGK
jgi:hypothetical protein